MATKKRKTSSSNSRRKSGTATRKTVSKQQVARDIEMFREIKLVVLFVVFVALFLCNFGILGLVGKALSNVMFGIFGLTAYIAPVLIYLGILFWHANIGNATAVRKILSGVVLFLMVGVVCDIISDICISMVKYNLVDIYKSCCEKRNGGGVLAGSLAFLLNKTLNLPGTILVVILLSLISLILLTEKSFLGTMKNGKELLQERHSMEKERRKEYAELREEAQREQFEKRELIRQKREEEREQQRLAKEEERRIKEEERRIKEEEREQKEAERRLRAEEKENEQILRMDKRARGVMVDTSLKKPTADKKRDDVHEITLEELTEETEYENADIAQDNVSTPSQSVFDASKINIRSIHQVNPIENIDESGEENDGAYSDPYQEEIFSVDEEEMPSNTTVVENPLKPSFSQKKPVPVAAPSQASIHPSDADRIKVHTEKSNEPAQSSFNMKPNPAMPTAQSGSGMSQVKAPEMVSKAQKKSMKEYKLPPLSLLQPGPKSEKDTTEELRSTALKLQETLQTFGVKVTITDVSQGPSVTRYELLPEPGVKVSKITNLQEDIKLYLAAADIRIEAPIPGKSAIGIEVPNKENMMVALRDLLESKEFKGFDSKIAFAVGKDIGGQTIVADIGKMPHMLIAGSTGSGKSVCINTLIMSILYKARPDEVKLIMVDPKVVELSVYNGIPHLLIPVVTDPKKASAALHWGVSEMEDRYRKFADLNVRDLKGYNKKIQEMPCEEGQEPPKPLPQIVIIVDELADLMMVCPGEVEESICRLAQLARAAGIHLIIATQRPSVDVITGLIKANMPSRVAFAVSSGVDSRTILDMNGAEKLLGKGDMLFYPQGYTKPARIQGAFVSDGEVGNVVDYLKNQQLGNTYEEAQEIEQKMMSMTSGSSSSASNPGAGDDGRDELFREAGKFIIDKDKASIGMLQRVFKIGFNRAARIMDQLCEYGVVGEEEGTKPRKVLMSMEQFEQLLEEI